MTKVLLLKITTGSLSAFDYWIMYEKMCKIKCHTAPCGEMSRNLSSITILYAIFIINNYWQTMFTFYINIKIIYFWKHTTFNSKNKAASAKSASVNMHDVKLHFVSFRGCIVICCLSWVGLNISAAAKKKKKMYKEIVFIPSYYYAAERV